MLTAVAQPPLPPVRTEALKGVDPVDAGAAVLTRRGRAVVDVCGTERTVNAGGFFPLKSGTCGGD